MQFVLRPFGIDNDCSIATLIFFQLGLLRRAQETPLWQHYKQRCVWNFEPRDILEMDASKFQQ